MNLTYISFWSSSSATTNPPRYSSSALTLEKTESADILLTDESSLNDAKNAKTYRVSEAQFSELVQLFCDFNTPAAVAALQRAQNPFDCMMGGFQKSGFTYKADSEEYSCLIIDEKLAALKNRLLRLLGECGDPIEVVCTNPPAQGGAFAPVDMLFESDKATPDSPDNAGVPVREGEWVCPGCGHINAGNFCSECGTTKP